MTSEDVNFKS